MRGFVTPRGGHCALRRPTHRADVEREDGSALPPEGDVAQVFGLLLLQDEHEGGVGRNHRHAERPRLLPVFRW